MPSTDTTLTPREQQTLDLIKQYGKNGVEFSELKEKLGVNSPSTLRPRLSKLVEAGKITSKRTNDGDARIARYVFIRN